MAFTYASRMNGVKASEIREILKLTLQPEIISFAGGLPAPELFPVEEMKKISVEVLEKEGQSALQYSPTEGYDPLRSQIASRMSKRGIPTKKEDVLITSGSQQGLDFSGKIFLDPGDAVLVESPSYLGAINAFKAYECRFVEVKTDDDGMDLEDLKHKLKTEERIKMIYVIPDFQNPSGRTWSLERRKGLLELAKEYGLPIVEDNPYGELRFDGETVPAIRSLDTDGRVIFLGSFSKTFCPGLRIGWVSASPELLNKYILVKQGADLQTNSMSQRELALFLETYDLDLHVEKIINVYRARRDLMLKTMEETFPRGVTWTVPEGGLFTWVTLPEGLDAKDLMKRAVERKVAFVPGASFFPNGGNENTLRMNYSNMPEEKIVEGIERLAQVIEENMR